MRYVNFGAAASIMKLSIIKCLAYKLCLFLHLLLYHKVAQLNPDLRELTSIFGAIDTACKAISNEVKRSQLPFSETLGYQGKVNAQGEDQKVRRNSR